MSESFDDVRTDFCRFLNDQAGVFIFARIGLGMAQVRFHQMLASADPDKHILVGDGAPSDDYTVGYQRWRIGDVDQNLSDDGMIVTSLGRQWIVSIYAHWEHEYRKRFAVSQNVSIDEFKVPIFGDLRLIRNDIVHNRGIASDSMQRCEVLRWFSSGDSIRLTSEHLREFMAHLDLTFKR